MWNKKYLNKDQLAGFDKYKVRQHWLKILTKVNEEKAYKKKLLMKTWSNSYNKVQRSRELITLYASFLRSPQVTT